MASVNTENIAYMITHGLSAAPSTKVSNELGAGNPNRAKHAMTVTLKLSILLALVVVLTLVLGHGIWIGFFSDSHSIIKEFADMIPLLVVSMVIDAIQGVLQVFTYEKGSDSVLLVKKEDYYKCERKHHLMEMSNGSSEFKFNHSGPFFFISGKEGHCSKGQKMIAHVMAQSPKHHHHHQRGHVACPPAHSPGHRGPVAEPAQSPYHHCPISCPPTSVPTASPMAHGPTPSTHHAPHSPAPHDRTENPPTTSSSSPQASTPSPPSPSVSQTQTSTPAPSRSPATATYSSVMLIASSVLFSMTCVYLVGGF